MMAVARGDLDALGELVVRHRSAAWSVAYRYVGDADEAEDLVQEAFLRILDAAGRYRPTASFRTYLYRVLTRLCIDHTRKKRPLFTDRLPDAAAPGPSQSERIAHRELDVAVRAALDALPPKYRMVIVLRYFEGLDGAAIAKATETTPKAVERLLARAREGLAPLLQHLRES